MYEFLDPMHIPFALDYGLAVCALCDIMKIVYNKFLEPECQTEAVAEAIVKIDEKIREMIIKPIAQDLKKKSQTLVDLEIDNLIHEYGIIKEFMQKRKSKIGEATQDWMADDNKA